MPEPLLIAAEPTLKFTPAPLVTEKVPAPLITLYELDAVVEVFTWTLGEVAPLTVSVTPVLISVVCALDEPPTFVHVSELMDVLALTMLVVVPAAATPMAANVMSLPAAALSGFQLTESDHSWFVFPLSQEIAAARTD